MDTSRFLKILAMALRTDASEAEAQVAFNKLRMGLSSASLTLEDMIPSPEGLQLLRSEAEEIKRIIKLSNAEYAQLVSGLKDQVKNLTAEVISKDKQIAKLTRDLAKAKEKTKKPVKSIKINKTTKEDKTSVEKVDINRKSIIRAVQVNQNQKTRRNKFVQKGEVEVSYR